MQKERETGEIKCFTLTEKIFAKENVVTFKGFSQVLLSRLCKTYNYITQLSLRPYKDLAL